MSLHFLIDGYNVIKQAESLSGISILSDARASLVRLIQDRRLAGSKNNLVTVFFDGKEGIGPYQDKRQSGIRIIFSRNEPADEEIKRMVAECKNPKQAVVVTDDKAVAYFSSSLGARVLPVSEFLAKARKTRCCRQQPAHRGKRNQELYKAELTYQQQAAINQELSKFWNKSNEDRT
ncbi:NYN domain-containing protein [Candidatus Omnitrophota bacterium]